MFETRASTGWLRFALFPYLKGPVFFCIKTKANRDAKGGNPSFKKINSVRAAN
jgi:hypothetical protein